MKADKCQLLITNHEEQVSIKIGQKWVKRLGIKIVNKLDFNEHVSSICKKASLKLHELARILPSMDKHKLRILMKAFIESQFGYCPLIWMFHSRTLNNKIYRLHERLVYKDNKSSFRELLTVDNSFTIHHRNLQKLATGMYKVLWNRFFPYQEIHITYAMIMSLKRRIFEQCHMVVKLLLLEDPKYGHSFVKISKTQILCRNSKLKLNIGNRKDALVESAKFTSPNMFTTFQMAYLPQYTTFFAPYT